MPCFTESDVLGVCVLAKAQGLTSEVGFATAESATTSQRWTVSGLRNRSRL